MRTKAVPAIFASVFTLTTAIAFGASASEDSQVRGSGPVHVMYAGSLTGFFEKKLGPAFEAATGFTFQGEGKGSL